MTTAGPTAAVVTFLVAGGAITVLAFAGASLVALGQESVAQRVAAAAPTMKRWGGAVLVIVGLWLAATGIFAESFAGLFSV